MSSTSQPSPLSRGPNAGRGRDIVVWSAAAGLVLAVGLGLVLRNGSDSPPPPAGQPAALVAPVVEAPPPVPAPAPEQAIAQEGPVEDVTE